MRDDVLFMPRIPAGQPPAVGQQEAAAAGGDRAAAHVGQAEEQAKPSALQQASLRAHGAVSRAASESPSGRMSPALTMHA